MFRYNQYAQTRLLKDELESLLPVNSFAHYLWRTIGNEIHYQLVDWPDESEIEFSSLFPVEALYLWVSTGDGLDPLWFEGEDGRYVDDNGELIPHHIIPCYSGVEQLAAYGLWLIYDLENYNLDGDAFDEKGHDKEGQTREFRIEQHATRTIFAYQALTYARKIAMGDKPSEDERDRAVLVDFSAIGKAGALKRHAPMAKVREMALTEYMAKKWPSARQASKTLKDKVFAYSKTIDGANMSEDCAQERIYEWILASLKDGKKAPV